VSERESESESGSKRERLRERSKRERVREREKRERKRERREREMSFICFCRNQKYGTYHKRLFRGTSTNDMKK
jgi:hypothetical protein